MAAAAPVEEPSPKEASGAVSGDAQTKPQPPRSAQREAKKIPATVPTSIEVPQPQSEGTAMVWRVLEGVAAFFGLIFLVALGFKWRLSGKAGAG